MKTTAGSIASKVNYDKQFFIALASLPFGVFLIVL